MVDPQQTQLVNALEQQATEAELTRNLAKDRLEIALYRSQQPNQYRWRQHSAAWMFAGVVGISGTVYALGQEAPYVIPLAAGAGLGAGLLSNAVDQRRQTNEKQDRLALCRTGLGDAEKHLRQAVTLYREEEETGWLMYALNTPKESLLALRTWMADPRRTMKDALLEAIDIITTQLQQPLTDRVTPALTVERQYRQMRQQLFDTSITLKKDEFLAHVFAKHHVLREQELKDAGLKADLWIKSTAVGVGSAAGLWAGTGITALGSKLAVAGSSKVAIAHAVTGTASVAAVLGAGLFAAGTVHSWMTKADSQRRQREAQQFQEAFTLTAQILEAVMQTQETADLAVRRVHLQAAYDSLNTLRQRALKGQDLQMKQYAEILGDRLQRGLKAIAQQSPSPRRQRLNFFLTRNG